MLLGSDALDTKKVLVYSLVKRCLRDRLEGAEIVVCGSLESKFLVSVDKVLRWSWCFEENLDSLVHVLDHLLDLLIIL